MREVHIEAIPLDRLTPLLDPERVERLVQYADRSRTLLEDRIVWDVNATATGGGGAGRLQALPGHRRGARGRPPPPGVGATPPLFPPAHRPPHLPARAAGDR